MKKISLIIKLIFIEMIVLPNMSYAKQLDHPLRSSQVQHDSAVVATPAESHRYLLDVRVDGKVYPEPLWIDIQQNDFYISSLDAKKLNIKTTQKGAMVNLNQIAGVKVSYNPNYLSLEIETPANWQPMQNINVKKNIQQQLYRSDVTPGLLLNYSLYGQSNRDDKYLSAFFNTLYYNHYGYFNFSGSYTSSWIDGVKYSHFNRLNTSFIINDRDKAEQFILGDFQTDQTHGFSAVYMAGIQFRKNYRLRPDLTTYPTLKISGTATVPSVMDLFVNGSKVKNDKIDVGPYIFNNIPFINGNGTITLVTTDQNGRKQVSTLPYHILTNLLKPGLSDFNFSLGALRYNYGLPNDAYKHLAFSGTYSLGVTNDFTATSHVEASQNLALLGANGLFNLNDYGNLNASIQFSHAHAKWGTQFYLAYNKDISSSSSFSLSHTQSIGHFFNLGTFDSTDNVVTMSDEAFYSKNLQGSLGSLGLGLIYIRTEDSPDTTILNLSYSASISDLVDLSLSYSRNMGPSNQNDIALQISIPFSGSSSFTEQYNNDLDDNYTNSVNLSKNLSTTEPLGWDLTYSNVNGQRLRNGYKAFSGYWNSNVTHLSAGIYGDNVYSAWASAQGSLVWLGSHLFVTKPLNGSFIEVNTNGIPNVPFYYNNDYQGKTNSQGIAFISDVLPYQKSSISIDSSHLPENVTATALQQNLYIPDNSGYVANFQLNRIHPLLVIVQPPKQIKLQNGNLVMDSQGNNVGILGYGNQIYLKNAVKGGSYQIVNETGQCCHFTLPEDFQIFSSRSVQCV